MYKQSWPAQLRQSLFKCLSTKFNKSRKKNMQKCHNAFNACVLWITRWPLQLEAVWPWLGSLETLCLSRVFQVFSNHHLSQGERHARWSRERERERTPSLVWDKNPNLRQENPKKHCMDCWAQNWKGWWQPLALRFQPGDVLTSMFWPACQRFLKPWAFVLWSNTESQQSSSKLACSVWNPPKFGLSVWQVLTELAI